MIKADTRYVITVVMSPEIKKSFICKQAFKKSNRVESQNSNVKKPQKPKNAAISSIGLYLTKKSAKYGIAPMKTPKIKRI